jgi:hypothetical protein
LRLIVNNLFGLRILRHRLGRHAIAAVDPAGKILKLAALAAEGNPGCLCGLATAKDTHASRHNRTFYLTLRGSGFLFPFHGSGSHVPFHLLP